MEPGDGTREKSARRYQSRRREDAAARTRAAILDAAVRLFLKQGYGRVTVRDIAREAAVAVPTVYASTGGKAAILGTLITTAMSDPVADQTLAAVGECRDSAEAVRILTHGVRVDNERYHDMVAVLKDAAASDENAARVLTQSDEVYRDYLTRAGSRLAETGALTPGLSRERMTGVLWFYLGHQSWDLLVSGQGWAWDDAERWLGGQLASALLAPTRPP